MASGRVPNMLMTLSFAIVFLLVVEYVVLLLHAVEVGVDGRVVLVPAQRLFDVPAYRHGGERGDDYEPGAKRAVRRQHHGAQAEDGGDGVQYRTACFWLRPMSMRR